MYSSSKAALDRAVFSTELGRMIAEAGGDRKTPRTCAGAAELTGIFPLNGLPSRPSAHRRTAAALARTAQGPRRPSPPAARRRALGGSRSTHTATTGRR